MLTAVEAELILEYSGRRVNTECSEGVYFDSAYELLFVSFSKQLYYSTPIPELLNKCFQITFK